MLNWNFLVMESSIQLIYRSLTPVITPADPLGLAYFADADGNEKQWLCDIPFLRNYRFRSEAHIQFYNEMVEGLSEFRTTACPPTPSDGSQFLAFPIQELPPNVWFDWLYPFLSSATIRWKDGLILNRFLHLDPYTLTAFHPHNPDEVFFFVVMACPQQEFTFPLFNMSFEDAEAPKRKTQDDGSSGACKIGYHVRSFIPLIWNETLQTAGEFRYGDMLKIRFAIPDELRIWNLDRLDWQQVYSAFNFLFPRYMPDPKA